MIDLPFSFTLPMPQVIPSRVDNHIERRLSALRGQFFDQDTYNEMLSTADQLIYEVYEIKRPGSGRRIAHGYLDRPSRKSGKRILYDEGTLPLRP